MTAGPKPPLGEEKVEKQTVASTTHPSQNSYRVTLPFRGVPQALLFSKVASLKLGPRHQHSAGAPQLVYQALWLQGGG